MRRRLRFGVAAAVALAVLWLFLGLIGTVDIFGRSRDELPTPAAAPAKDSGAAKKSQGAAGAGSNGTSTRKTPIAHVSEKDFNRDNFDNALERGSSTDIDNAWFPHRTGTQLVYDGTATVAGKAVSRRVETTVTDLTKVVDGVRARVLLNRGYTNGELVEESLTFLAQDKDGTVWQLGSYAERFAAGVLKTTPTWVSGLRGASAGIVMQAAPKVAGASYSMGRAPNAAYLDRAQVRQKVARTCVPAGCYTGVLVIGEAPENAPEAHRLGSYARGVGAVRLTGTSQDPMRETLQLASVARLAPKLLVDPRIDAVALEKNAYARSLDAYARTAPILPTPATLTAY